jgi:putative DNA methylase
MSDQVTRGDLPHQYQPGYAHFVTYRLANSPSIPTLWKLRLERERRLHERPPVGMARAEYRERVHKIMFGQYDQLLDGAKRMRWLADERIATVVRENLYHHHGSKYELLSYCVMPNHVHVVLQPFESALISGPATAESYVADAASVGYGGNSEHFFETPDHRSVLTGIMHSLKSYTANRANEILERSGSFWQKESYDHWIRDLDELERIIAYVAANPVRAGLCDEPHLWRFSSAYDRFEKDQSRSALIGWLRDNWRR